MNLLFILLPYLKFLYQGYIMSVLLNLIFSNKVGLSRSSVQNIIGIFFMVGLSFPPITYILEFIIAWYSGVDAEQYVFPTRAAGPYWSIYLTLLIYPVIILLLNTRKKLRIHFIVIILTSLIFAPLFYEFILILITSENINIANINHVYLVPFKEMLLYGIAIYLLCIIYLKIILKVKGVASIVIEK